MADYDGQAVFVDIVVGGFTKIPEATFGAIKTALDHSFHAASNASELAVRLGIPVTSVAVTTAKVATARGYDAIKITVAVRAGDPNAVAAEIVSAAFGIAASIPGAAGAAAIASITPAKPYATIIGIAGGLITGAVASEAVKLMYLDAVAPTAVGAWMRGAVTSIFDMGIKVTQGTLNPSASALPPPTLAQQSQLVLDPTDSFAKLLYNTAPTKITDPDAVGGSNLYTVQLGDSLWKIAQVNGWSFSALQQINPQITDKDFIVPGQIIHAPPPVATINTVNTTTEHTNNPTPTNPTGVVTGGTSWVTEMDPTGLNTGTTFYDGTTGDSASDGIRPGNWESSGMGGAFTDINNSQINLTEVQNWSNSGSANHGTHLISAGVGGVRLPIDPLVLDLNGDGVRLTSLDDSQALFDMDHDGVSAEGRVSRENTAWVAINTTTSQAINTDGLLVKDLNGNGTIDGIKEVFSEYFSASAGNEVVTPQIYGAYPPGWEIQYIENLLSIRNQSAISANKKYPNGFDALRSLDENKDAVFSAADSAWSGVHVWVDKNGDGLSFDDVNGNGTRDAGEASELRGLADLGISAIKLNSTFSSGQSNSGNTVISSGTFTRNGQDASVQSVQFEANPLGHTIDRVTASGTVIATQNPGGSGVIKSYVSSNGAAGFSESLNATALGVANVYAGAGNDALAGDDGANWLSGSGGADSFNAGDGDDVLLIDADDLPGEINAGLGYDVIQTIGDRGVRIDLGWANAEAFVGSSGDDYVVTSGASSIFVQARDGDDVVFGGVANDVLSGQRGDDLIEGGAGNDLVRGHEGMDVLGGGSGNDVLNGGIGDDYLDGGLGDDVLVGGHGDDVLNGGAGVDVVEYEGGVGNYKVTRVDSGTWQVRDIRTGASNADTLVNIEKLSFADIGATDINIENPIPIDDIVRVDSNGLPIGGLASFIIAANQVLANDMDWHGGKLTIKEVFDVSGGSVVLDAQGDLIVTPDPDSLMPVQFSYRPQDETGHGAISVWDPRTGEVSLVRGKVLIADTDFPEDPFITEQTYLSDLNIFQVWADYTGKGVDVAVNEVTDWFGVGPEIFDYRHEDLQANVSRHWLSTPPIGLEEIPPDISSHATGVAGVIAAAKNKIGTVGIAYDATLSGQYVGWDTPGQFRSGFYSKYDVVNNSWGWNVVELKDTPWLHSDLTDVSISGRQGLGTIFVISAGNDRAKGQNTNLNALASDHRGIVVGAIEYSDPSTLTWLPVKPFSTKGANILIAATGENVNFTGRILSNTDGSTFGREVRTAFGTSLSAPIVSGIVALMLEANPNLGYRDVQAILALTARRTTDISNSDWVYNGSQTWNGGGMHVSHEYGYGKVDALAAVRLAETWVDQKTYANETKLTANNSVAIAIPDGSGAATSTIVLPTEIEMENAKVKVQIDHPRWGDLAPV